MLSAIRYEVELVRNIAHLTIDGLELVRVGRGNFSDESDESDNKDALSFTKLT